MACFVVMQLAGVVAVEVTGGPEVPFHPGREVCLCLVLSVSLYLFIWYSCIFSIQIMILL